MRSKDKEAPVDTSGERAGLADVAGSPEAAQGSAGKNTGGIEAPMQKPGAEGGIESHPRKQLRNRHKWKSDSGGLPYWEIKAKTALLALYRTEHWPMLSTVAKYESELAVQGKLLDEVSSVRQAHGMVHCQ